MQTKKLLIVSLVISCFGIMSPTAKSQLVQSSHILDGATLSYQYVEEINWAFELDFRNGQVRWQSFAGDFENWLSPYVDYNARRIGPNLFLLQWLEMPIDPPPAEAEELAQRGLTLSYELADMVTLVIDLENRVAYGSAILAFLDHEDFSTKVLFERAQITDVNGFPE